MNNYYEFTKLINDEESFKYFNSLPINVLKNTIDDNFNYIESYLNYFAKVSKDLFNGADYDEFYYSFMSLIAELNDIKIIINILKERNNNE